jgi:hypothetical protein
VPIPHSICHYFLDLGEDFEALVAKPVFTLLYYILIHLYEAHFEELLQMDLMGHLNALFSHLFLFVSEFKLVAALDLERFGCLGATLIARISADSEPIIHNEKVEQCNSHPQ